MNIEKTLNQVSGEIETLIQNYRRNISTAFENNGYDLNLTIKVNIKGNYEKVAISPTLEFYPESKIKSEKYTVSVEEKQIGLPLKSVSSGTE